MFCYNFYSCQVLRFQWFILRHKGSSGGQVYFWHFKIENELAGDAGVVGVRLVHLRRYSSHIEAPAWAHLGPNQ